MLLLGVLTLAPAAILAQESGASGDPADAIPQQTEEALEQTEMALTLTQEAQAAGGEETPAESETGPKVISGMSILGNQEAPTSLVIVPWKSSVIGDSVGISTILDDSRAPVDREVFMRALRYYEIQSETAP
jgi:hypothetical protein